MDNERIGGTSEREDRLDRSSTASVRNVIERIYPDPAIRRACLGILADSIRVAHRVLASSWGVTLHSSEVRLNVGYTELCLLRREAFYLVLEWDLLDRDQQRLVEENATGQRIGKGFKSTPGAYKAGLPLQRLGDLFPIVVPAHLALVERQARKVRTRSNYHQHHSSGVLSYLTEELGVDVPTPDYGAPLALAERRFWKISPGPNGREWQRFRERGIVAMDWGESFDVRVGSPTSRDQLKEQLTAHGGIQPGSIPTTASQLWLFYHQMKPGDGVCAYSDGQVFGWGKITGDYDYVTDDFAYQHRRTVEWQTTDPIPGNALPPELWKKIRRAITLISLSEAEFSAIRDAPRPHIDLGPDLSAALARRGLHYTAWQIAAFYTALQTKGFVILTGISGTGKTKLPQWFAEMTQISAA